MICGIIERNEMKVNMIESDWREKKKKKNENLSF